MRRTSRTTRAQHSTADETSHLSHRTLRPLKGAWLGSASAVPRGCVPVPGGVCRGLPGSVGTESYEQVLERDARLQRRDDRVLLRLRRHEQGCQAGRAGRPVARKAPPETGATAGRGASVPACAASQGPAALAEPASANMKGPVSRADGARLRDEARMGRACTTNSSSLHGPRVGVSRLRPAGCCASIMRSRKTSSSNHIQARAVGKCCSGAS